MSQIPIRIDEPRLRNDFLSHTVKVTEKSFDEIKYYRSNIPVSYIEGVGVNCSKFDCSTNSRMSRFLSAVHVKYEL